MSNIIVYDAEKDAGLTEIIKANASVELSANAKIVSELSDAARQKLLACILKSKASNLNQPDLHYLETILVTSAWNANDDVFGAKEIYLARHTPEDKPFNYEHNENDIIGHITGNEVIDFEGNVVADDLELDKIPENIHIKTSAVLYKHWEDTTKAQRIESIIAEIEKGEWFVSMEALMNNFDYALIDDTTKAHKIVARTKETAFLTKHLRRFGGKGQYENFKIGRYLRGITFAGKGLVRKPANKPSVILTSHASFSGKLEQLPTESKIMSESESLAKEFTKELAKLQQDLVKAHQDLAAAKAQLDKNNVDATTVKVQSLEEAVKARDEQIKELNAKAADLQTQLDGAIAAKADGDKAEKETEKKYKEAAAKLAEYEAQAKTSARVSALEGVGQTKEVAEATVKTLSSLDDAQFDAFVAVAKTSAAKPNDNDADDQAKKDKAAKEKAANDALLAAKAKQDLNLGVTTEDNKVLASQLTDKLADLIKTRFMKTTANVKKNSKKENA